jgi:RNA polymerase sigma-70 factor (ECF subfamily)
MMRWSARPVTALGGLLLNSSPAVVPSGDTDAVEGFGRAEELLAGIAKGDYAAFREFYEIFQNRVFGLAMKLLRDQGQAEEVAQETFLQLWQQASRFDRARGSAVAWVLRITHARSVDRIRASQRSAIRDSRYVAGNHTVETDTVVEDILLRADQLRVRRALLQLSAIQRESIQLAYYSGVTTQQIADHLGVARPTVKTRIRDGLIRLASELRAAGAALGAT